VEIKLICGLRGQVGAVGRALLVRPDGYGGHLSGGNPRREANITHQSETRDLVPNFSPLSLSLSLTKPNYL